MTLKELIIEYLKINGYDGLCNPDIGCGCGITGINVIDKEGDNFIPCDSINLETCEPAYRWECENCKEKGVCEWFGDSDGCWKLKKQE